MSKKTSFETGNLRTAVLGIVLGVLIGIAGYHFLQPKQVSQDACAHRIADIGGPSVAIEYVCYGKSLQQLLATGQ